MSSSVTVMNEPEDVNFTSDFKRLYELHLSTDVDFDLLEPNDQVTVTFSVHKLILSLWSPYFTEQFFSDKNQKINILQYKDVDPEAFEAMLRFMYGYSLSLQDPKKALELYKVATQFQVSSLQKICHHFLSELKVEPFNVFDILNVSNSMNDKSRRDTCLKLIQQNTEEVIRTFDLSGLSSSMLDFFLDLPRMSLKGEYDLVMWVFSWANSTCEKSNQCSNIREVLEPFLPKLNFLALSGREFTTLCCQWPDVFTDKEIISIFMNIEVRGSNAMTDWYDENRPFRIYNESLGSDPNSMDFFYILTVTLLIFTLTVIIEIWHLELWKQEEF